MIDAVHGWRTLENSVFIRIEVCKAIFIRIVSRSAHFNDRDGGTVLKTQVAARASYHIHFNADATGQRIGDIRVIGNFAVAQSDGAINRDIGIRIYQDASLAGVGWRAIEDNALASAWRVASFYRGGIFGVVLIA